MQRYIMYHGVRIDVINSKYFIANPMFHPFEKTTKLRVATMKIDKVLDLISVKRTTESRNVV